MARRGGFNTHKGLTLSACLSLPKVEGPGHSRQAPSLSDAVVQSNTTRIQGSQSGGFASGNWGLSSGQRENDREHGMGWIWKTVSTLGKFLGQP